MSILVWAHRSFQASPALGAMLTMPLLAAIFAIYVQVVSFSAISTIQGQALRWQQISCGSLVRYRGERCLKVILADKAGSETEVEFSVFPSETLRYSTLPTGPITIHTRNTHIFTDWPAEVKVAGQTIYSRSASEADYKRYRHRLIAVGFIVALSIAFFMLRKRD